MAHKKKHSGRTPAGNQPHSGPTEARDLTTKNKKKQSAAEAPSAQEQDAKRRIGDFTGTGEPSFQQPGGRNDANH